MNFAKLILLACLPTLVWADNLEMEYASLYSHSKTLEKESMSALQFAFGFKHVATGKLCEIQSAVIHTDKQDIKLQISAEQRFTPPTEKALKLANALVRLELTQNVNQCDMSVQLETKPEWLKARYAMAELQMLLQQYQTFFEQMGGFLSFMMPKVKGLVLHLDPGKEVGIKLDDKPIFLTAQQGQITLDEQWLGQQGSLTLTASPIRITAWTD